MRKRCRPQMSNLSNVVLVVLFLLSCMSSPSAIAQKNELESETSRYEVLQEIDSLLQANYVLPDKAVKYAEEFKKKYEGGHYNTYLNSKEFAEQVTADLIRITNDKHIKFRVIEPSDVGENPETPLHHPVRYHILGINENKGFSKLEWLEGNVGYVDIRRFYNFPDIKDRLIGAMKFLSNASAIIVDLRENGGGSGDYLSSYFLEYPTQLSGSYSRQDDFVTEFWTLKDIGTERLTEVPLFLLTSKRTFSASESFAYDMKVLKRATIIGESTKGGAHSVDLYKIGGQFEIYIPTARAINPTTGGNWEGTGVIPDIMVPSEAALDTALVLAKEAGAKHAKTKEQKLRSAVEEMEIHMERAEQLFRDNEIDEARTALESVFQLADENDLINEFFIDVLAYEYRSQSDEQILYAILETKIELFPNSPTAHESMAYAYYKNARIEPAIGAFEKVLELDPDNRNAMRMIERLRRE